MGLTPSSSPATLPTQSTMSAKVPRRKLCLGFARRPCSKHRSHSGSSGAVNGDSDLQLTANDKEMIRSTWLAVSSDPYRIGARVFLRIFELEPEARKLFRFDGMTETELIVNGLFRIHASRFIRAIDLAVNNLDALDLVVVSNLIQLGRQHALIVGFKVEYLDAFRTAMTDVWEAELGSEQFAGNTRKAWSELFLLITNSVLEGYQQRCSELKSTTPSVENFTDLDSPHFDDDIA